MSNFDNITGSPDRAFADIAGDLFGNRGFAEAVLAFQHHSIVTDAPLPTMGVGTSAALQLVAHHETDHLAADSEAHDDGDRAEIAAATDFAKGIKKKLEELRAATGGSPEIDRMIGELELAIAQGNLVAMRELGEQGLERARSTASKSQDSDETQQQRMQRLFAELERANEAVDRQFEALDPWLTEQEREARARAREDARAANERLQQAYANGASPEELRQLQQQAQEANSNQNNVETDLARTAETRGGPAAQPTIDLINERKIAADEFTGAATYANESGLRQSPVESQAPNNEIAPGRNVTTNNTPLPLQIGGLGGTSPTVPSSAMTTLAATILDTEEVSPPLPPGSRIERSGGIVPA